MGIMGTYNCKHPIHTGSQAAGEKSKEPKENAQTRSSNADAVRNKHSLVRNVQSIDGVLDVLCREADILQRKTNTRNAQLVLHNGDGIKGEHGPTGAVGDDLRGVVSTALALQLAFTVTHDVCGVEVVEAELISSGLDHGA